MNTKLNWLIVFIFVFAVHLAFAGGTTESKTSAFSRIIELKNPRMQGTDIVDLQNRLLGLGFIELGEADGYYGPKTEGVVKKIKTFLNYTVKNGKVDRLLWDFIFTRNNDTLLANISIVSKYDESQFKKIENDYMGHSTEGGYYAIYYSTDRKVKILKMGLYGEMMQMSDTYFFVSSSCYFNSVQVLRYEEPMGRGGQMSEEITMYYLDGNRAYEIKNGIISPSDLKPSFIEEIDKEMQKNKLSL